MIVGRLDKRTAKTLMRALNMIVSDVFADEFSQVRLTQRDDAVEAFFFDRADEAFDERAGDLKAGMIGRWINALLSCRPFLCPMCPRSAVGSDWSGHPGGHLFAVCL